ncbi:putative deoxyhypusine synthase [Helianthus anomalus]
MADFNDFVRVHGYDFNQGGNYPQLLQPLGSTDFEASKLSDAIKIVNQMVCSDSLLPDCCIS